MVVNEVLNQADGTVLTDTMGLVTWVADMRSGVKGTRQWTNQFTYFKDQFGSSIGVIFWNRPDVKDLKGKIVLVKSGKDGDMKVGSYNNKKQLNVAESCAVTVSEGKNTGGQKGSFVKSMPAKADFAKKQYGTSGAAYAAVIDWAVFTTHQKLSKVFGNLKTVPDGFMATVNTCLIAYGNGVLVPDAMEIRKEESRALEIPDVEGAKSDVPQVEAGNGSLPTPVDESQVDPSKTPTPGTGDDDIPF